MKQNLMIVIQFIFIMIVPTDRHWTNVTSKNTKIVNFNTG